MTKAAHSRSLTPARLEAFSDGVLAVVITIMVLELKVPHESGMGGLNAVLPILSVYILSFTFTGIYWVNHHLLVHRIAEIDGRILYSNLLFLFCSSLLPYFTSWVLEKDHDSFSVVLYTSSLLTIGFSFMLLRLAIERRLRLAGERTPEDGRTQRKHWISLGLYLLSIPVALRRPGLAMLVDALVNLVWILPDLGTHRPRINTQSTALSPQNRIS